MAQVCYLCENDCQYFDLEQFWGVPSGPGFSGRNRDDQKQERPRNLENCWHWS